MAQNIIYYGPPGTGKTYLLQSMLNDYTDFDITDAQIISAYTRNSKEWLLIALIILQNKGKMQATDIQAKVDSLVLRTHVRVSSVLEKHQISPSPIHAPRENPRIFFEVSLGTGWYVDRIRLLKHDPHFFETYLSTSDVDKRYSFVTFHQSFSYEDFIEGIRPTYDAATHTIDYSPKPGIFKLICEKAINHPEKEYAIFIDEINRGNIAEIFGELISLIEVDKRKGEASELSAELPYSKEKFVVPNNLNILGTMNSADKSIANIDIALRRRFSFVPMAPDSNIILRELEIAGIDAHNVDGIDLIALFETINKRIEILLDANHLIGHAYFMSVRTKEDIAIILAQKIIPLLEEYFYDDLQKIQLIFNDLDSDGNLKPTAIYQNSTLSVDTLFPFTGEYLLDGKKRFFTRSPIDDNALRQIYEGITP